MYKIVIFTTSFFYCVNSHTDFGLKHWFYHWSMLPAELLTSFHSDFFILWYTAYGVRKRLA